MARLMKPRFLSSPAFMLEYSEIAMSGNDSIVLYAYERSKKCPWSYGFDYHLKTTQKLSHLCSSKLVWC